MNIHSGENIHIHDIMLKIKSPLTADTSAVDSAVSESSRVVSNISSDGIFFKASPCF